MIELIKHIKSASYSPTNSSVLTLISGVESAAWRLVRNISPPGDSPNNLPIGMDATVYGGLYFRDPDLAITLFDLTTYNDISDANMFDLTLIYEQSRSIVSKRFKRVIFGASGGAMISSLRMPDGGEHKLQFMPFTLSMPTNAKVLDFIQDVAT